MSEVPLYSISQEIHQPLEHAGALNLIAAIKFSAFSSQPTILVDKLHSQRESVTFRFTQICRRSGDSTLSTFWLLNSVKFRVSKLCLVTRPPGDAKLDDCGVVIHDRVHILRLLLLPQPLRILHRRRLLRRTGTFFFFFITHEPRVE